MLDRKLFSALRKPIAACCGPHKLPKASPAVAGRCPPVLPRSHDFKRNDVSLRLQSCDCPRHYALFVQFHNHRKVTFKGIFMSKQTTTQAMPVQPITQDVLLEKYAKGDETNAQEIFRRVARGIAQAEKTPELQAHWEEKFFQNMMGGAIGAGRIMSAAGTNIKATLANCFVQPVGDAILGNDDNGLPGIYESLKSAAETMRRGGGVGYDFSPIRPKGALVKGTASNASGPCSYMNVFDASCETVESAGARRGAQMGVLSIDHPDIYEFIGAKRTPGRWKNFNVSVMVTDAFILAKNANSTWQLVHAAEPGEDLKEQGAFLREDGLWVYRSVKAVEIWDMIMRSNYDYAEPGILFKDKINQDNNLRYVERLLATNPCGEQPLPAYGCCDLGPMLLPMFVIKGFTKEAAFDFDRLRDAVKVQVRFLDNVLDVTHWPLQAQAEEAASKRRIGVGLTGLGNALAMLGIKYNSAQGRAMAARIAETMRDSAYEASIDLAIEKGSFPLFDADKYLEEGTFASRLPDELKERIRQHGIRNSHSLSVAPTGTVSLAFADNASNSCEPPFALAYSRKKRMPDGTQQIYPVVDHGLRQWLHTLRAEARPDNLLEAICAYKPTFIGENDQELVVKEVLPQSLVTALEMSASDHLEMVAAIAPFIDSAISKTVNVPADYAFEDFKLIYDRAWELGIKGVATYRPNNIVGSVLSIPEAPATASPEKPEKKAADIDPLTRVIGRRAEGDVESVTRKVTYNNSTGTHSLYVSVSFTKVSGIFDGRDVEIERPLEVFIQAPPDGVPMEWVAALSRNLSLLARSGLLPKALQDNRVIRSDKGRVRYGVYEKTDGTNVPRFHESEVACIAYAIQEILAKRGLIDADGGAVPTRVLLKQAEKRHFENANHEKVQLSDAGSNASMISGKKCRECGDHTVIKKDGCEFCTSCGHIGSCG